MTMDLQHLTYQEYLELPEMNARYSVLDGELVSDAAPTLDHQAIWREIAVKLMPFVRERQR